MVTKLAISSPTIVVASLETLVEPLRATVSATLKENAVKQQQERHEELLRSGTVSYTHLTLPTILLV